ncbi:MAG: hypothetical protein R3E65_05690 [Steroidobacteraceae bacterium]
MACADSGVICRSWRTITAEDILERAQQLLRVLVKLLSATASRSVRNLSRESGLALSAATVRNVMADLEHYGFVRRHARHRTRPDRQGATGSSSTRC